MASMNAHNLLRASSRSRLTRLVAGGSALAALVFASRGAKAQTDVTPPLPDVLILLDTSGSMERMPDATLPVDDKGIPLTPNTRSSTMKNRWVDAIEVLGGGLKNYSLLAQARNSTDFKNEFGLGGQDPYDSTYDLFHYRPLSNNCTIGSTSLSQTKTDWPTDWTKWGAPDFGWRLFAGTSLGTVGSCTSSQYSTDGLGVLDTFRDQARFALMTFDSNPDPSTGWTGTAHDPTGGMKGLWSYFQGWKSPGTAAPPYG